MFDKKQMLKKVKEQISKDYNCSVEDLYGNKNIIVEKKLLDGRRVLESENSFFKMMCIEGKIVVSASSEILQWCNEKLKHSDGTWALEYPNLIELDNKIKDYGHKIIDIHEYYLPCNQCGETKSLFKIKWYEEDEIDDLKNNSNFGQAFAYDDNCPDVLAVAAFDGDKVIACAGASRDSEDLWQIGIDVLNEYRCRGVASNLVALLKDEILLRGKIPYYGTVQSHMFSKNVAINAGFAPVFIEVYTD